MRKLWMMLTVLLGLTTSGVVSAEPPVTGLALDAKQLGRADREFLERAIMADRLARPAAYDIAALAKGCRPEGWMAARSPSPTCTREMRALGQAGLLPMISALAFDWQSRGFSADAAVRVTEERAVMVAMIDAVGLLRDTRARPVLLALWQKARTDKAMQVEMGRQMTPARAVAEALGRLGGAVDLQALLARLRPDDTLNHAAIAGLGACKRQESAQALTAALTTARTPADQAWIVQAMGAVASSWAWQAMGPTRRADGLAVRKRVTDALLPLLVTTQGAARERVVQSLQLADMPDLTDRLHTLRANADATLQHDIDDLLGRVARAHATL